MSFLSHILTAGLISSVAAFSVLLTIQSIYTLYTMLYTWDRPEAFKMAKAPTRFLPPRKSFTVMLPARHEEEVIQTTIERVVSANYPLSLLEVVVICSIDDTGTIAKAQQKIAQLRRRGINNVRVLAFKNQPINKPHGLNVGLASTHNEVVTIFNSEDDIHPDIFNVMNTVMLREKVAVVQGRGATHELRLEVVFGAQRAGILLLVQEPPELPNPAGDDPAGREYLFFTREVLERVGGWDEHDLTEDADIGIRISLLGERIRIIYDDRYVTQEETPPSLSQFVKQRTRWNQGFLQTLAKGEWKQLPKLSQRALAVYTLGFPIIQAMLGLYVIVSLLMMFFTRIPAPVAILMDLPFYLLVAHFLLNVIGLYEFTSAHGLKAKWKTPIVMALSYLPYQWVLCYAAVRATSRYLRGINNWEKTKHTGAHRQAEAPAMALPLQNRSASESLSFTQGQPQMIGMSSLPISRREHE